MPVGGERTPLPSLRLPLLSVDVRESWELAPVPGTPSALLWLSRFLFPAIIYKYMYLGK